MSKLKYLTKPGLEYLLKKFHKVSPIPYGIIIDSTNSDPEGAVTYTENVPVSAGWENWKDMPIYKDLRPCVLKEGKVQYYLRRNDYTAKVPSGKGYDSEDRLDTDEEANLNGTDGEVYIEVPFCGYKLNYEEDNLHVSLTNKKNQDGYCYYAHSLDDVGDCDYIYIGAYLLSGINSNVQTLSGQNPKVDTTMTNFRTYVQSKGDGNQLLSWYVWNLMQVLYLIVYKNLNSQSALGMGYVTSNSAVTTTGQTDSTGFCSNSGSSTDGKHQVKCLGIEDFWGNAYQWCDGIYCDSSYNILTDYKNFHNTGSGYQFSEPSGFTDGSYSYIKKAAGNNNRAFLPIDKTNGLTGGSTSTYFCDYCDVYSSHVASVGRCYSGGTNAGAFYCSLYYSTSDASSGLGARAIFKHKNQ